MTDKTTISVRRDDKDLVDATQEQIAAELGISPTQGEAVVYACREFLEGQ
jgi:hypothetical protein